MSNRLYNQFSYSPERQPVNLMGKFTITAGAAQANRTFYAGDLTLMAKMPGAAGNDITLTVVIPLIDGPASLVVTGTNIVFTSEITTGSPTSTITDIVNAITSDMDASALVTAGPGSGVTVSAIATSPLQNGTDIVVDSNAMNMSLDQSGTSEYTIQLEDEFPEVLSVQISIMKTAAENIYTQIQSADTGFGTAKAIVFRSQTADSTPQALDDGTSLFVHLILRNSSNP